MALLAAVWYELAVLKLCLLTVIVVPTVALKESYRAALSASLLAENWIEYPWTASGDSVRGKQLLLVLADYAATDDFQQFLKLKADADARDHPLRRVVFDEAHEILFSAPYRDAYLRVRKIAQTPRVQLGFVSATCNHEMRNAIVAAMGLSWAHFEIISAADDPNPTLSRPELAFSVVHVAPSDLFEAVRDELARLRAQGKRQGLVYCASASRAKALAQFLNLPYVIGSMDNTTKLERIAGWLEGRPGCEVLICTSAIGAGVDNRQCDFVVHAGRAYTIGEYIQQSGRAGRSRVSGATGTCVLFETGQTFEPSLDQNDMIDSPLLKASIGHAEMRVYADAKTPPVCRRLPMDIFLYGRPVANCYGIPGAQLCDRCAMREVRPSASVARRAPLTPIAVRTLPDVRACTAPRTRDTVPAACQAV